jgi:hypothetical protein
MADENFTLATFNASWNEYQGHSKATVAPLIAEQLALRAAPGLRPIGENAAHIIGWRAGWFTYILGKDGGAEVKAIMSWDESGAPARTAAELVQGLEATGLPGGGGSHRDRLRLERGAAQTHATAHGSAGQRAGGGAVRPLTRCGYGYIATLLAHQGRRVEAISARESRDGVVDEVVDEIVAVITSMAARSSGRRTTKRRAEHIQACVQRCVEQAGTTGEI